ncbi:MAG: adenylate kinase family protein [Thermoplasmata archaeon]|nr:adenylate kinase family protein [Thermoplasmata archaeon]
MKIISLTGTPGTGKSNVSNVLESKGYPVLHLNEYIREKGLGEGWDEERESVIVDPNVLSQKVVDVLREGAIVEGHLSHYLSPEVCVVLRTSPTILYNRLIRRGYNERKARENAEAEALGIITSEAMESCPFVYEVDTTKLEVNETAEIVERIYLHHFRGMRWEAIEDYRAGRIDYLEEVLEWY